MSNATIVGGLIGAAHGIKGIDKDMIDSVLKINL